jgi:hypothetical protein
MLAIKPYERMATLLPNATPNGLFCGGLGRACIDWRPHLGLHLNLLRRSIGIDKIPVNAFAEKVGASAAAKVRFPLHDHFSSQGRFGNRARFAT